VVSNHFGTGIALLPSKRPSENANKATAATARRLQRPVVLLRVGGRDRLQNGTRAHQRILQLSRERNPRKNSNPIAPIGSPQR